MDRVREIDPASFHELEQLLRSPSANVAYMAARVFLATVANDQLPPVQREDCRRRGKAAIAAAVQSAPPWKVVAVLEQGDEMFVPQVRVLGPLREILQDALLKLTCTFLVEPRDHHQDDGFATLRFRQQGPGGGTFDLRIGDRPAADPVPAQRSVAKEEFQVRHPFRSHLRPFGPERRRRPLRRLVPRIVGPGGPVRPSRPRHQANFMKRFTIPCDFGGEKSPFHVYVGEPSPEMHPLFFQSAWLAEKRGGSVPKEVMESFEKLHAIAKENNVSFEDLCVYALGTAADNQAAKKEPPAKE